MHRIDYNIRIYISEREDRVIFEDSLSLYLIKIIDSKSQGDISPKSYVVSTLKQMILNERKAIIMSQLKNGILNDAIMNNKFEIY